jgi:valyl-tRNA synthetase
MEGITLPALNASLEGGNLDAKEVKKAQLGQAQDYPEGIPECGTDAMRFALVAYTVGAACTRPYCRPVV